MTAPNASKSTRPRASNATPSLSSSARCRLAANGSAMVTFACLAPAFPSTRCHGTSLRLRDSPASEYPT